jgi:phosphoribosyl-AMP cyclohydrolase / phosphoribosyl-ATP pyrophosphohydrolase
VIDLDTLDFTRSGGLVTVVVQDSASGRVLMVAHADRAALEQTIACGEMHFYSRLRGAWHKGATSGNVQKVVSLHADCDGDAVLARVVPAGPACHTGSESCFTGSESHITDPTPTTRADLLETLDAVIAGRIARSRSSSYTARLLADRNLRLKKLGEEAAELGLACADADRKRAAEEAADLVYHALVALRAIGVSWSDVRLVLAERRTRADRKALKT